MSVDCSFRQSFSSRAFGGSTMSIMVVLLLVSIVVTPSVRAELASSVEMENVCENWLTQTISNTGDWAGGTAPVIVDQGGFFAGDTLIATYYNISPEGFVLVPILKEMQPVKAYSDEGYFDPTEQDGFVQLMREVLAERVRLYESYYGSLETVQADAGDAVFDPVQRDKWDRFAVDKRHFRISQSLETFAEKGPLTTTTWHQSGPYNDDCPMGDGGRCVVGCTATAAAQIMAYWQWPPHGLGSHTYTWEGDNSCDGSTPSQVLTADFSDAFDWANIPDNCDGGCTVAQQEALAELSSEMGIAFEMDYGACGSGAWPIRGLSIYPDHFGYSPDVQGWDRVDFTQEEWFLMIQAEIEADRVIAYQINSHAIVCDGWRDQGLGFYEFHMNYGWGGGSNAWYVLDNLFCPWIDGDVCPYDQELMLTHIYPQTEPVLVHVSHVVDDSGGDSDGHADVGETVELSTTVYNSGFDANNATGQLSTSDAYVTVTTSTAVFDASIVWGGQGSTQTPFVFEVDPSCPDPHVVEFDMMVYCDTPYVTVQSFEVFIGDTDGFEDDIESGPGNWTHEPQSNGYVDEWHLTTYRKHSGSTSWKAGGPIAANYSDEADGGLITPPFLLPGNAAMSFWHWMSLEEAWDGGVVYISVDAGPWEPITPDGGYTHNIIDNPVSPFAPETPCYSGAFDWTQAVFDLSDYSGVARIMFRFGSDGASNDEGWYVDDIEVYTGGCCGIYTGGLTGNTNCSTDGNMTLSDITRLIDFVYVSREPLCCPENGNTNGDAEGDVTLSDITRLIDNVYISGEETAPCN